MADLIFCAFCQQDVSHDGVYVIHGGDPMHRDCFIDYASDRTRLRRARITFTVGFDLGPNFKPGDIPGTVPVKGFMVCDLCGKRLSYAGAGQVPHPWRCIACESKAGPLAPESGRIPGQQEAPPSGGAGGPG